MDGRKIRQLASKRIKVASGLFLTEAYQPALERAALEAFEGRYDDVELGQKVDRAAIEQKALQLITVRQEG